MAEQRPGGGEPTEPPSEKKLRDARRRGEVARSRELPAAAVFIAVFALFLAIWPAMLTELRGYLQQVFAAAAGGEVAPAAALSSGLHIFRTLALPIAGVAMVGALVASYAQVGGVFSWQPIKPSLRKISPATNASSVFGKKAGAELLKSAFKLSVLLSIVVYSLWQAAPGVVSLVGASPEQALLVAGEALFVLGIRIGIFAVLLGAFDLAYQRWTHRRRLRMTKQELKREQKEMEGDPHHKSERQRLHREILEHQQLQAVADADCVIINPTHLAVALRYDAKTMAAPRVLARGQNLLANKIKAVARRHGVPVIRDVPLARALVELELDDEVPPQLYEAVAEVLRFVYHLAGDEERR